jgi:hypothetical protein
MSQSSRGATSLLFAALVLPLIVLGLSLVFEVSEYFNSLRMVQEILDSECRVSLSQGRRSSALKDSVEAQIKERGIVATVQSVAQQATGREVELTLVGKYQGRVLFRLLAPFIGAGGSSLPIRVSASMRGAKAATLVLLEEPPEASKGDEIDLATRRFGKRLIGELKAAHLDSSTSQSFSGAAAIRFDRRSLVEEIRLSAVREILARGVELPSVTVVMRNESYEAGFCEEVLDALKGEAQRQKKRLRVLMAVVGSSEPREEKRNFDGEFGSEAHLLFVTEQDLEEAQFVHAVARMIVGRAVIQR